MKNILLSMAAISAIGIAAPAAAQSGQYQNQYQNQNYQNQVRGNANLALRIGQLQTRIQTGVQAGTISRQEAGPLRQQLRQLTQLERQYRSGGISVQERQDLQVQLRNLRQQVRKADNRRGTYADDRWDYEDGYAQNGQYAPGYQGQYNGQYQGQYGGNVYTEQRQQSGLGGILGSMLGIGGNAGLRVGQRASGNLYAVPAQFQNQFRDGNGIYYRSDGRNIYQIDARTQAVLRVYTPN